MAGIVETASGVDARAAGDRGWANCRPRSLRVPGRFPRDRARWTMLMARRCRRWPRLRRRGVLGPDHAPSAPLIEAADLPGSAPMRNVTTRSQHSVAFAVVFGRECRRRMLRPSRWLFDDRVDALVGGVFFVVEGADIGSDSCLDTLEMAPPLMWRPAPGTTAPGSRLRPWLWVHGFSERCPLSHCADIPPAGVQTAHPAAQRADLATLGNPGAREPPTNPARSSRPPRLSGRRGWNAMHCMSSVTGWSAVEARATGTRRRGRAQRRCVASLVPG